jgi:phosphatidylglycerol:prolipoprotein diacylglycerol transferase
MQFPTIDPIAFSIGPIAVRWYALAYLVGLVAGWRWCMNLAKNDPNKILTPDLFDEFLTWAIVGVIVGGRLGYVLFYNLSDYIADPLAALKLWQGGMSFHGGMLGVIGAAYFFTRVKKIPFFAFTDLLACATPIGLGLGRVANFINGELFGRQTDVPWGVVFPRGGLTPRHPSQLYEAALEGLVLLAVMIALSRNENVRKRIGFLSGVFLTLYGVFRFGVEFFREPDLQLGVLFAGATMGQLLSVPMIVAGLFIIGWSLQRPRLQAG